MAHGQAGERGGEPKAPPLPVFTKRRRCIVCLYAGLSTGVERRGIWEGDACRQGKRT